MVTGAVKPETVHLQLTHFAQRSLHFKLTNQEIFSRIRLDIVQDLYLSELRTYKAPPPVSCTRRLGYVIAANSYFYDLRQRMHMLVS